MKKIQFVIVSLLISNIFLIDSCFASDIATFESFFKESISIGWIFAGISALAIGAAVYFTGGLASPFLTGPVAWVGSMIGGAMGLSGAAATNAGLALLGGGAVTAGGLGMAGGAALLAATFEFGTGVIAEYGITKVMTEYTYSMQKEESMGLPNFPPFCNDSGPDFMEDVVSILKDYKVEELPSSPNNIKVLEKAYSILKMPNPSFEDEEFVRFYSARSLILFMMSDFKEAYRCVDLAIRQKVDTTLTVPKYIASICGYVTDNIEKDTSISYFIDSIADEPDNPFIPLMYSMYISRLGVFNKLTYEILNDISYINAIVKNDEYRKAVYYILQEAYFSRIKVCQMTITVCYDNKDNDNFDRGILKKKADNALSEYQKLILGAGMFISRSFTEIDTDNEEKKEHLSFIRVLNSYENDIDRLKKLCSEIEMPIN